MAPRRVSAEELTAQAQQQLRVTQRMESLGQLAGGLAHDFNNMLSVVLTHAEFLRDVVAPGSEAEADIETILEAAHRAAQLTRQLLDVGRRRPRAVEQVDLNRMVRDLHRLFARVLGEDVEIATLLSDEVIRVLGDRTELEQILMNLVLNARDAMPGGGNLTIESTTVEREGRPFALLSVQDDGSGMDDATRARIFEAFFTTKRERGTGLGLAVTHGIVTAMGGSIEVCSELAQGTTFSVYLPLSRGAQLAETSTVPGQIVARGGGTVLLVEDHDRLREAMTRTLERDGYRVLVAAHGRQARKLYREAPAQIDLLVTDVVLPDTDAESIIDGVRREHPRARVLCVSGHLRQPDGVPFLAKPFSPRDFLHAVHRTLRASPVAG